MMRALILTYHAIEPGPPPLCVHPDLFRAHVETVVEAGARVVNVSALAEELSSPPGDRPLVAFTFDDGFASVARFAAPMLSSLGLSATVFCVAGHIGGLNDWPTDRVRTSRSALLSADQIRELAASGIEIGSHGFFHVPAPEAKGEQLEQETQGSRSELERLAGSAVRAYAYPYGAVPHAEFGRLVRQTYGVACTTRLAYVDVEADLHALPRIDAHYLRRPDLMRRAVEGSLGRYLVARRLGSRARRVFTKDYITA